MVYKAVLWSQDTLRKPSRRKLDWQRSVKFNHIKKNLPVLPERESQAEAWWHPVSARLFFGFLLIKVSVNRDWAAKRSRDVSVTRQDK